MNKKETRTSASPTITTTVRPPRGITCARSPSRTLALPSAPFPRVTCTFKPSSTSGLKRPPGRSFPKSSFSFSNARSIPLSNSEQSNGSWSPASGIAVACARFLYFLVRPWENWGSFGPLLRGRGALLEKGRVDRRWREGGVRGWSGGQAVFTPLVWRRKDSARKWDGDEKKALLKECLAATSCSCMVYMRGEQGEMFLAWSFSTSAR
jgi:hypothetical protein